MNYGRISDFQHLVYNLSLNLTGHVCIVRYGKIYRGNKVNYTKRACIVICKVMCVL